MKFVLTNYDFADIANAAYASGYKGGMNGMLSECMVFCKGSKKKSVRVTVYFFAAVVCTCLNHSGKGKAQVFHTKVNTLDHLRRIFENPVVPTNGEGYYVRKNIGQPWKDPHTKDSLSDSARRWIYIGAVTGLVRNEAEQTTVTQIVTKCDALVWNPGSIPSRTNTRFDGCSPGALFSEVLLPVMLETCGDVELRYGPEINAYRDGSGPKPVAITDVACESGCLKKIQFMEEHADDLLSLRELMMSLHKPLRLELTLWLLQRDRPMVFFTDLNAMPYFSSNIIKNFVHRAHMAYGELYYSSEIANMCPHCGVIFSSRE